MNKIISNKTIFQFSGFALFLLTLARVSFAADYYVSPTGAAEWANCGGATPLNGTSACSWQTAMSSATAGDMVYFRGGIYDVGIIGPDRDSRDYYGNIVGMKPRNSGTAGNPITFIAYPSETPIITGTVIPGSSVAAYFGCSYRNYITWDGFSATLQRYGTDTDHDETQVWAALSCNYCTIKNSNFTGIDVGDWNYNTSFVRIEGSLYSTIQNNYLHDLTGTTNAVNTTSVWLFNSTYTTIVNNTVVNTRGGFYGKLAPTRVNAHHNFIYNPVQDSCQDGIFFTNSYPYAITGHNIYQNVVVGCTRGIRLATSGGGTINDTKIFNNTIYQPSNVTNHKDGIFAWTVVNLEVYNNIISGSSPFLRYDAGNLPSFSNYNNFHGSGYWNLNFVPPNFPTIDEWRTATNGLDANSMTSSPNFVNPGGSKPEDYKRTSYPSDGREGSIMGAYITGNEVIGYVAPQKLDSTPPIKPKGLRIRSK